MLAGKLTEEDEEDLEAELAQLQAQSKDEIVLPCRC
jgi:hypothetical protein